MNKSSANAQLAWTYPTLAAACLGEILAALLIRLHDPSSLHYALTLFIVVEIGFVSSLAQAFIAIRKFKPDRLTGARIRAIPLAIGVIAAIGAVIHPSSANIQVAAVLTGATLALVSKASILHYIRALHFTANVFEASQS